MTTPEILLDIARNKGPEEYIILLGIAAWEPGQLDSEMVRGDWDKKINNYTFLFTKITYLYEEDAKSFRCASGQTKDLFQ